MAEHLTKGRWAELVAQAHFVRRGWLVFQAVDHHGLCDLVLLREEGNRRATALVDVKYADIDGSQVRRPKTAEGVYACYVFPDGGVECELTSKRRSPDAHARGS